ncbi:MAG: hypothetical protein EOO05_00030 [Chitinophagaceae bacterium]|nr:MAG: hypothetical protein EOO05_00030 [Chitinophagaceae bacterium]
MKKIMLIAGIGVTVLAASAFQAKESNATQRSTQSVYEQADTVPGKRKGDTAKHRYPKDTTRKTPPKS